MEKNKLVLYSSIGVFIFTLLLCALAFSHKGHPNSMTPKRTMNHVIHKNRLNDTVLGNKIETDTKTDVREPSTPPFQKGASATVSQNNDSKNVIEEKQQFANQKVVFLTFDDGPSNYTSQFLDILKENNIQATFFLVGNYIKGKETILNRILSEGNVIGLHSMTHNPKQLFVNPDTYIQEFEQEQQLLASLGIHASISRSPYGSKPYLTQPFRDKIAAANLKLWDWTIDSNDWRYKDKTDLIINEVARQIKRQHEVVLMHDHKDTLKALPAIIKLFKDRGYIFETYNPDLDYMVNFWKDTRL